MRTLVSLMSPRYWFHEFHPSAGSLPVLPVGVELALVLLEDTFVLEVTLLDVLLVLLETVELLFEVEEEVLDVLELLLLTVDDVEDKVVVPARH